MSIMRASSSDSSLPPSPPHRHTSIGDILNEAKLERYGPFVRNAGYYLNENALFLLTMEEPEMLKWLLECKIDKKGHVARFRRAVGNHQIKRYQTVQRKIPLLARDGVFHNKTCDRNSLLNFRQCYQPKLQLELRYKSNPTMNRVEFSEKKLLNPPISATNKTSFSIQILFNPTRSAFSAGHFCLIVECEAGGECILMFTFQNGKLRASNHKGSIVREDVEVICGVKPGKSFELKGDIENDQGHIPIYIDNRDVAYLLLKRAITKVLGFQLGGDAFFGGVSSWGSFQIQTLLKIEKAGREKPPLDIVESELAADASDVYNRWLKYALAPFFTLYALSYFLGIGKYFGMVRGGGGEQAKVHPHVANESGLRMQLKEGAGLPQTLLNVHAGCAVFLLAMVLLQKWSVTQLHRIGYKQKSYALTFHRWAGRSILFAMVAMDAAGFLMGPYVAWENFTTFEYLFAAPWLLFFFGIYTFASKKTIRLHRLFGNMLLKACIATPLARLAGSLLQRSEYAKLRNWTDETSYYVGIASVSAFIAIWQVVDIAFVAMSPLNRAANRRRPVVQLKEKRE